MRLADADMDKHGCGESPCRCGGWRPRWEKWQRQAGPKRFHAAAPLQNVSHPGLPCHTKVSGLSLFVFLTAAGGLGYHAASLAAPPEPCRPSTPRRARPGRVPPGTSGGAVSDRSPVTLVLSPLKDTSEKPDCPGRLLPSPPDSVLFPWPLDLHGAGHQVMAGVAMCLFSPVRHCDIVLPGLSRLPPRSLSLSPSLSTAKETGLARTHTGAACIPSTQLEELARPDSKAGTSWPVLSRSAYIYNLTKSCGLSAGV
ncbi:hypothetical protein QBC47DRAFT_7956 [Echria macrotheca]|uniref:Uncharacterized protein n=1 Tax=Echria macrotheca TaxID=438768 RepID=A0AAJ0FEN3_9PEZI|nr:hypothetical protein QBC47DRAFT_7956 [Echria macrotheca]